MKLPKYFVSGQTTSALGSPAEDYDIAAREIIRRVVASSETVTEIATESSIANLGLSDKVSLFQPLVTLAGEGTAALGYNYASADPFADYLAFYCKMSGTDGATSAADETGRHSAISFVSGAQIDTAQKSSGVSSLLVSGGYVAVSSDTDFNFQSDDFTIKVDVRITSGKSGINTSAENQFNFINKMDFRTSAAREWRFHFENRNTFGDTVWPINRQLNFHRSVNGSSFQSHMRFSPYPTQEFTNNAWHSFAIQRVGNTYYTAVNDQVIARHRGTATSFFPTTNPMIIGNMATAAGFDAGFPGHLDEIKIYRGVGIYTPPSMIWHDRALQALMTGVAVGETRPVSSLPMGTISSFTPLFLDGDTYAERDGVVSGLSDGSAATFYIVGRLKAGDGASRRLQNSTDNRFNVDINTSNKLSAFIKNPSNTTVNHLRSTSNFTRAMGEFNIAISMDASSQHFYLDGVDDLDSVVSTGGLMDFTPTDVSFGGALGGANKYKGDLMFLFWPQYIDLSVQANRDLFYANGKSVDPSESISTLGDPTIYFRSSPGSAAASALMNHGTGGDFVVKSGEFRGGLAVRT